MSDSHEGVCCAMCAWDVDGVCCCIPERSKGIKIMNDIQQALKLLKDPNLIWSDDFEQIRPFLQHFLNDQPQNQYAQILAQTLVTE